MASSVDPPETMIVGAVLSLVAGLLLVDVTSGEAGSTLVLGGTLLLFSSAGLAVQTWNSG